LLSKSNRPCVLFQLTKQPRQTETLNVAIQYKYIVPPKISAVRTISLQCYTTKDEPLKKLSFLLTPHCSLHYIIKQQEREMRTERQKSLKPILTLNQSIYSAYWPPSDPQRLTSPQWYPGTISNIHLLKLPADIKYGYIHYYSIKFDDGDYCKMVEEHLVMDRKEYELSLQLLDDNDDDCDSVESDSDGDGEERKKAHSGWKGVKNVCDRQSADNWAKHVGW